MPILRAYFESLSPNVRGALWMLLAALVWSVNEATIKGLGRSLDPFQIAFFRCFFGGLWVLPFLLASTGTRAFRTRRFGGHFVRAAAGYVAMALAFYSIVNMPLADATALGFTRPLFMVVLAVLFLGEIVRWRRWTATAVGFLGVVVMARPGLANIDLALMAAIGGAFFVAVVSVMIKKLAETEHPATIIFYFGVISSILALGPALLVWKTPTLVEFLVLFGIGAAGSLGQYLTILAFRIGEATAVDPFDYVRLIYASLFGFLFFAELPDRYTLLGAAIIVASTWYIAQREARLRREAQSATTPPVSNSEKTP
jgi:drug/metabolite transporter (DMT)-like permease